jgi:arabinose-5-phosphate isomerase
MLASNLDVHHSVVTTVMTSNCTVTSGEILAAEAMQIMQKNKINALIVVDRQQKVVGALNMHDLVQAGIV